MNNADFLFNSAQLAASAYAILQTGRTSDAVNIEALQVPTGAGMSPTQATAFAARYPTVVTQYADTLANGGLGTGFNATVFMDVTGQLTLAIRGTDSLGLTGDASDLSTDADIAGSGAGYDQIVAMVNWWARASAPAGQMVNQFRLVEVPLNQIPSGAVVLRSGTESAYVLNVAPQAAGLGLVAADATVSVTGHSLGGHLAMAFATLFPGQAGQVAVFNAPGFTDSAVNQAFFAKLGGAVPVGTAITNVIADEALVGDVPFNLPAGLHSRPGTPVDIAIENQWNSDEPAPARALNHSIVVLTDSLAVYKLLADLAPTSGDSAFTTADYKRILNQAVQGTAAGYERIVDALQKLFSGDDELLPVGNGNREALYQAIRDLTKTDSVYASRIGQLSIEAVTGVAGDFVTHAQTNDPRGLAWRYTLKELDPFAVIDANNTGVYARFQTGGSGAGELDLYDPATRTGTLTTQWLEDRAGLLQRRLDIAAKDENNDSSKPPVLSNPNKTWAADDFYFEDRATGYILNQGANGGQRVHDPYIIFGTDRTDGIAGSDKADRLYGGGGTDYVIGKSGADYLEGGTGLDIYEYDVTRKSALSGATSADGHDTILDVDGRGVLRYLYRDAQDRVQSTALAGVALKEPDGKWKTPDGRFVLEQTGADLKVSFGAGVDASVTLKDFDFTKATQGGFMGLRLAAGRADPQTTGTVIQGDLEPQDANPVEGMQTTTDALGNVVVTANAAPGREDTLYRSRPDVAVPPETAGNNIQAGGGNDSIYSDRPNGVPLVIEKSIPVRWGSLLGPMTKSGLIVGLVMGLSACAMPNLDSTSWQEEVLLHDGRKIIAERSVSRGGRREIGQRPSYSEQTLSFMLPGTRQKITWEDEFSKDIGGANFLPMLLDVSNGTAYLVAYPMGCLSYNKWGRPNPPYVIFRYQDKEWRRISLPELPAAIKTPNLIFSQPDVEVEKSGERFMSTEIIRKITARYVQPEFKTILRQELANSRCPQYSSGPKAPNSGDSDVSSK